MRVLTVGNMYPPHHFGGYELVWRAAVEHLRKRHDVRVLTTDFDTGTPEPDDADVHRELRWWFRDGDFESPGPRAELALARHNHRVLERHLDEFAPEVVSWWSMGGLTLSLIEAARRRGIPAVAFVHDEWLDYGPRVDAWSRLFSGPRRGRLAPLAERVAGIPVRTDFGAAAEYVFVSDFTRRHARGVHVLPRTSVAHSGIHPDFLTPAPEQEWSWRLLYVGRLDARKGIDTAVAGLAELPAAATLTIAGGWDEGEEGRLRELAADLGVAERVRFAGQVDRAALVRLYADADVTVFPVRWNEPWGLVPLEAMARGRAVVATGRGGSGEYLEHERNCLLFSADSPTSMAEAVQRLAADSSLRRRLREAGLETARRHTEPVFNASVEAAVQRAAAGRGQSPERRLKVMHVGSGVRPFRRGGLVAYVEDLANEQVRAGHSVTYLFAGRYYPGLKRPRLRHWRRGPLAMAEIVNSPLHDHGFQPDLEVSEPQLERLFAEALADVQPDVVHVHELCGFPSSVLDVLADAGTPTIVTLQDYFALCPSFKLVDHAGAVCLRRDVGADCVATMAADERPPALLYVQTATHVLGRLPVVRRLPDRWRQSLGRRIGTRAAPRRQAGSPAAFQARRDRNVERLNRVDRVVAMSSRVAEIHAELGVRDDRLLTRRLTLAHIEHLRPRPPRRGDGPIVFATLGGGESAAKGADVLLGAMSALSGLVTEGRLVLRILGTVAPEIAHRAARVPGVEMPGRYRPQDQDAVLDDVDVGIVPSIWEEAYAYAGVEFLAKAIPVIANRIGGMVDYTVPGRSGWLNDDCSAAGLAEIMRDIVLRPEQLGPLREHLLADRATIVIPMRAHGADTEELYREVIG